MSEDSGNKILRLCLNQTNSLLFVGTSKGFRIIKVDDGSISSLHEISTNPQFIGGFSLIAPMFSTQLLCLVGSSLNTNYPPNYLYFWDEYNNKAKGDIRFRTPVKNVLIRRDMVVIILEKLTYVYMLNTLKPVASIPTIDNEFGIGAISYDKDNFILATLNTRIGNIRVENFYHGEVNEKLMYESPIGFIMIDFFGNLGACTVANGTIIRVFDCKTLDVIHDFVRGSSPAVISSMAFSPNGEYLLAASNKSTIHLWNLKATESLSVSKIMSRFSSYFNYERSVAKIQIIPEILLACEQSTSIGPAVCWRGENEFYVAHLDGKLYLCKFDGVQNLITIERNIYYMQSFEEVSEDAEWITLD